jgi:hypothetical protein
MQIPILVTAGVALAVVGGTKLSPTASPSTQASGHTFSKIGTACFLVAYIILSGVLVLLWRATARIPPNHRKVSMAVVRYNGMLLSPFYSIIAP